jgi:hypothetical protein
MAKWVLETIGVDAVIVAVPVPLMVVPLSETLGSDVPSMTSVSGFEPGPSIALNPVIVTVADELVLYVAMALAGPDNTMITPKAAIIVAIVMFLAFKPSSTKFPM